MSRVVEIPASTPYVAGHFPGRPILPGVVQLALALEEVAPSPVRQLVLARFRRLITPPVELGIDARELAPGRIRVGIASGGVLASTIELALGAPEPAEDWRFAVASRRLASPPALETLLPHRAPMLFVDGIVGEAEDGLTCTARVPAGCALVHDGFAPAVVALEAAAQAAAAWAALLSSRSGGDTGRLGFLVSARDVELHESRVPAGAPLLATARLVARAGNLAHYGVEVSCETQPVLRGTLGAYLEDRAPAGQSARKQNH